MGKHEDTKDLRIANIKHPPIGARIRIVKTGKMMTITDSERGLHGPDRKGDREWIRVTVTDEKGEKARRDWKLFVVAIDNGIMEIAG
jgi:hypothetical protein